MLHSFQGGHGKFPQAGLIDVKGTLFGTTTDGGAYNGGVVFKIETSGREKTVYSFCGQPPECADGGNPEAGLIDVKGTLYGTTFGGGTYDYGTVFAFDPNTRSETVLHSFGSGTDGQNPAVGLIDIKGKLYGTTERGGAGYIGTVFTLDPKTRAETVLFSFCQVSCTDGAYPNNLINVMGMLYGTTGAYGDYGGGTAYSIDPKTGAVTLLYSFCSQQDCTDGRGPSGLIYVEGTLYGTTEGGGSDDDGTVFSLDPTTGAETVLHSFAGGADGEVPVARLINVNGTLYGTTELGGGYGCGTVFALKP